LQAPRRRAPVFSAAGGSGGIAEGVDLVNGLSKFRLVETIGAGQVLSVWGGDYGTSNDRVKFGTYARDGFTGLDYADQRFYASTYGNFTSPDPSMDNVDYTNPGSWNAYAYTNGDPINGNDPSGLQTCGQTPIVGGAFNGMTVSQVMTGTTGNDLLAQSMWLEAGTSFSSDLASSASVAAYIQDVTAVGTRYAHWGNASTGRSSRSSSRSKRTRMAPFSIPAGI
jgi:RHS repeat-associated protein